MSCSRFGLWGARSGARLRASIALALSLLAWVASGTVPSPVFAMPDSDRYFFGYICEWISRTNGPGQGLAIDDNGAICVVTPSEVLEYTNTGTLVARWGSEGENTGQFCCAAAVAMDDSGNVYVADPCLSRIQKFTHAGTYLTQWGSSGQGPGQFDYLMAIAVDDSGNVYASDGFRIEKFTSTGMFLTQWGLQVPGDEEPACASGVAIDRQGQVYVLDRANGRVLEFTTAGDLLGTWAASGTGLAVSNENEVYVVDEFGAQVVKYDGAGLELDRWGSLGHGQGQFMDPVAVAVHPNGDVIVADADEGRIQRFGVATRWLIAASTGPGGSITPLGDTFVAEGMSQSYTLAPRLGQCVSHVLIDGVPVGQPGQYIFPNVMSDHTICATFTASNGWPNDPVLNLPVCVGAWRQRDPKLAPDGAGGAFIAWTELHSENNTTWSNVRAQHIDPRGMPQWPLAGVDICADSTLIRSVGEILADGSGGMIVLWSEKPSLISNRSDLHAQRLGAGGGRQWPASGVSICPDALGQPIGKMVGDGAGGAIIAWSDWNGVYGYRVFAQHIASSGEEQWGSGGVQVRNPGSLAGVVPDGSGGAIVVWSESRSGSLATLYAQHMAAVGGAQWTNGGVPVSTRLSRQFGVSVNAVVDGGAIVAWVDAPDWNGNNWDIYAQRISVNGEALWSSEGKALCTAVGDQGPPQIVTDGTGGAIVAWEDRRSGADVYAQRISASGTTLWDANGVPLGAAVGDQVWPKIVADGVGGGIATWVDFRRDAYDIYAQRVNPSGAPMWLANGVVLSTAAHARDQLAMVPVGSGGAILAWRDSRNWDEDIYAQRVDEYGVLGGAPPSAVSSETPSAFVLEPMRPNPLMSAPLTLCFTLPDPAAARAELLDVAGRRIVAREVGGLGPGRHSIVLAEAGSLAPGLYFLRLVRGREARTGRVVVLH